MTATTESERLPRMSDERGERLRQLIEGRLGLNQSQATEAIRSTSPTFSYKTLSRVYAGRAHPSTMLKVEDWAQRQLAEHEAGGSVGGATQTVEVDQSKVVRLVARNVYGAEEIVAEGGSAEEVAEAMARLMRDLRSNQEDRPE